VLPLFYTVSMLNAENAQLRPNILGTTAEEEEKERR